MLWSRQYEPTIAELRRKYEVVVRKRALLVLQRDRLTAALSTQVCRCRAVALKGHAGHVLAMVQACVLKAGRRASRRAAGRY